MPICKREGFENVPSRNKNETFQDHEEVFFCEVTKEIFRDYDDYFRHVMVINSTVWMCEATSRDNLTYAEALKSERRARRIMDQFKDSLRPAVMLVIDQAKQSSLNALHTIASKFLRRRFFINEEVTACHTNTKYKTYKVLGIVPPTRSPPAGGVYEDTDTLQYKLRPVDAETGEIIVPFEHVRRQRFEFTSENLHMFIKNNVTRSEGILRPKPEAYKQYVTDRGLTFAGIFIGKMPHFTPAKIKRPQESKKQSTLNKFLTKDSGGDVSDIPAQNTGNKPKADELAKREQDRAEKAAAKAKSLREEMERVRLERQEKLAEQERLRMEKRAKLQLRIEAECTALLTKTDDLERRDQLQLPAYTPVETILPSKLLGDAFMLREFMHSFSAILSGIEVFRNRLSFYEMTRAFTVHEVAGPLSDIALILLGTVFDQQREEEEECRVRYLLLFKEQRRREPYTTMSKAARAHFYCRRHFSAKLNELPLDAVTLSEVLRLHLLSSGACVSDRAEKWRTSYRNGYVSSEDPGLALRMQHPHIIRALKMYTLYQLPFVDIMRVLRCLMAQILTYSGAIGIIDERMEEMAKARMDLRTLNSVENVRLNGVQTQKRSTTTEHNLLCMDDSVKGDADKKSQLEEKLAKRLAEIQSQSDRDHKRYVQQVEKLQSSMFNYLVYLGMDRAYRKYYVLESMPGIFVEHPADCMDTCLVAPPTNAPPSALTANRASMPRNRRDLRSYLLKMYTDEEKRAALAEKAAAVDAKNGARVTASQENKENQAHGALNGLTNGHAAAEENGGDEVAQLATPPTQYQLLMCTGDPRNCIVHDDRNADRQRWAYLYKESEIDELIERLNPLGEREAALREQLKQLRTLLLAHVRDCPTDMLSVSGAKQLAKFKAAMTAATQRKYMNFGWAEGSDLNELMHTNLVDRILQFENEIYTGNLGHLKVKDMAKWRADVQGNTYDAQCKLQWGPPGYQQRAATMAVLDDEHMYGDDVEDNADADAENGVRYAVLPYIDPGNELGDTVELDSEDSADEGISLHDSQALRAGVHSLASALLQVEQSIERRFIKEPYGVPARDLKTKEQTDRRQREGNAKLRQWEVSLMESVSYSQVLLHLNLLHDAILWARSTNKSLCQICRRGSDPDRMLLCDECNGGTHMFCMKPKMKTVPAGNWYCQRCVKRLNLPIEKTGADAKKKNVRSVSARRSSKRLRSDEIEDALEEDEQTDDEVEDDEAGEEEAEGEEDDTQEEELDDGEEEEEDNEVDDDEQANDDDDEEEEEQEAISDEEATATNPAAMDDGSEEYASTQEDEDVCIVCSYDGSEVSCTRCKDNFHLECINLKRPPRYSFLCGKCKVKDERKRKTRPNNDSDLDDDEDTESSEPIAKRSRPARVSLRNSVPNGAASAQQSDNSSGRANGQRRSNRRTADNLPLNSPLLYKLLEEVMKHDKAWPFLRPVTQSQVPDYHQIIKTPMDFAKVKSKLNTGAYQLNEEVINDIQLIFSNCDKYNTKGNEVFQAGATLETFVISRCKELGLAFKPSDMNN